MNSYPTTLFSVTAIEPVNVHFYIEMESFEFILDKIIGWLVSASNDSRVLSVIYQVQSSTLLVFPVRSG